MDAEVFKIRAKQWINNKLILANTSTWYKQAPRKDAILHVKNLFGTFLNFPSNYSIAQLAIQLKRHEDLLLVILPIPHNPSYEKAFNTLSELMAFATEFIDNNNLKHML